MHKLGIIVPYRNRPEQLAKFRHSINEYITDINFELIIVDQQGKDEFNRGRLLNIGFKEAEKLGCDYVVFHDVDMLPIDVDYSYSDKPLHLITDLDLPEGVSRTLFDEYFGGVTLFPVDIFKQINGYTNLYQGWGFEDDNLLLRCLENHIELDGNEVVQKARAATALEFNGEDSYVAIPNRLTGSRNFSIFASFGYDEINVSEYEITDNNSIFSIPGFDTTLTINSFFDLTFQFWKKNLESISIPTKGLRAGRYNVIITVRSKVLNENTDDYQPPIVKMYVNGKLVGENTFDKLFNLRKSKYLYLGVGDPDREEKRNWFKGTIDTFATYNTDLTERECLQLGNNTHRSLFGLESGISLSSYYDCKFVDFGELLDLKKSANGTVVNCKQVDVFKTPDVKKPIPFRREGKFEVLTHKENGYKDGYWVSWSSRENQLKYLDSYYKSGTGYQRDGLSTCNYKIVDKDTLGNYHHILVK